MGADVSLDRRHRAEYGRPARRHRPRLRVDDETAHLLVTLFPMAGSEEPVVIAAEWEPWYGEAVKAQRSFYWEHYSGYLADERGWDPNAIAALDVATDRVVERLSDPTRAEAYQAKGLVVGLCPERQDGQLHWRDRPRRSTSATG